ncbi:hypothetical protein [Streptomyces sp. NPDC047315]|uniref:hypothetical protein n=1 Tax=Streptomyces sp. NPDC047315 TaxID=3155142 RepID=UPI0033FEC360
MDGREFSADDVRLVDLLRLLQELSPEGAATACRITLRDAAGDYVGEALLDSRALEAAVEALASLVAYRDAGVDGPLPVALTELEPDDDLDPRLEADLEEYCIGLNCGELMGLAAADPARAVAAFDEITGF